jgi:2'-5' RNA ligase
MRLFVALATSEELRERLAALIETLRKADAAPRWVNPRNLHITLKFIGEVPQEKLAAINEALAAVRVSRRLSLQFRGLGFFPHARRPAVVWVGIESSEHLALLAAEIDRTLAPLGIPREERPFLPHLTIARFKQTRVSPALATEIDKRQNFTFGEVAAGEFHLMESKLKSGGAEYTTLRSFPFTN